MSNVQTGAERTPHDMSHFVYSSGRIGCLKVLSHQHVGAGDSIEMNTVGSFRLSPLKRGLALDTCLELFTFYIPYRHCYDAISPPGTNAFVEFMKGGSFSDPLPRYDFLPENTTLDFLGVHNPTNNTCPAWLWRAYQHVYNNYFKLPSSPDMTNDLNALGMGAGRNGLEVNHLKTMWSAPLEPNFPGTRIYTTGADSIDLVNMNAAYGTLHSDQTRSMFMKRYRDVIESFGGKTTIDADFRPQLLMRSKFWASGYEVDGTSDTSLGQFSGRVQQSFSHKVPRWYCPEHGVVMTFVVPRFPPVTYNELPFNVMADDNYDYLINDPAIIGNRAPTEIGLENLIPGSTVGAFFDVPHGQWMRYHPSYVDFAYREIGDFPFVDANDFRIGAHTLVNSNAYSDVFQSDQLNHWNMQIKFNDTVYRAIPTARDSLLTN